ncbi:hypothetical protein QBC34DRAFT_410041 [Podospora aff. communis PSN243]|uniref:F-box domain-containing protein n=1 Tax=Podospora aff. communis PSN243 TaxID=3040156 RepID=A0AAV9GED2_9PEZI|nr:hypothetical protein QBC34DRAFT_410041 [Podospora aff. communis PSN243]
MHPSPANTGGTELTELSTLPTEVLCVIISHLDPISLIAIAQTSRAFRTIVSPSRDDFVQRLLALELLPEFGGIVPIFRGRDNALTPPWNCPEWRTNKYACSLCLKLRSHTWFDNHSILRLGMRKPPPGSREASKTTDWEPLELRNPAVRWKRIQQRAAAEEEELRSERQAYRCFCTGADNMDGTLMRVDFQPIDKRAEEAEMLLCGRERYKRACVDCRWKRGDWRHPHVQNGSPDVPVVKSRQIPVPDAFERHFPGFINFIQSVLGLPASTCPSPKPYPRIFKVWQEDRRKDLWTLYTAPCHRCSRWQEFSAFRHYLIGPKMRPSDDLLDEPNPMWVWPDLCNQCAHESSPSAFPRQLTKVALQLAKSVLSGIEYRLCFGWNILRRDFRNGKLKRFSASASKRLLSDLPYTDVLMSTGVPSGEARIQIGEDSDVLRVLDSRIKDVRTFLQDEIPGEVHQSLVTSWFQIWLEDHELNVKCYKRMQAVTRCLENPGGFELLQAYFHEVDPYSLGSVHSLWNCGGGGHVQNLAIR